MTPAIAATLFMHSKPIRWIFYGGQSVVTALEADAGVLALLDNMRPFFIRFDTAPIPLRWNNIDIRQYKAFADIQNALVAGVAPSIKIIMYDYENWAATPLAEQQNPAPFVKGAAALVHAHGLLFLPAPAVDLVTAMAPGNQTPADQLYIQLQIAADAARYADIFLIQSQRFQLTPDIYASFVQRAAAQARQANPSVRVFAAVSTYENGAAVSAEVIMTVINATRMIVDGYLFNIPAAVQFRPDIAIDVLHRLR